MMEEYSLDDSAGRLLLLTALEAFDRMKQAQAHLRRDGTVTTDRFGQARAHPAVAMERDSRASLISALKTLHIDNAPEA
jgi:phage terminase small subunit